MRAIGMIAIENSNLEISLADLLGAILNIPDRAAHDVYFTPRTATLRVQILRETACAVLRRSREARAQVARLMARSLGIINKRNEIMHNAWGILFRKRKHPVVRYDINKVVQLPPKPVPFEHLQTLVRDLRVLIADVDALTKLLRERAARKAVRGKSQTNPGSLARTVKVGKAASAKN